MFLSLFVLRCSCLFSKWSACWINFLYKRAVAPVSLRRTRKDLSFLSPQRACTRNSTHKHADHQNLVSWSSEFPMLWRHKTRIGTQKSAWCALNTNYSKWDPETVGGNALQKKTAHAFQEHANCGYMYMCACHGFCATCKLSFRDHFWCLLYAMTVIWSPTAHSGAIRWLSNEQEIRTLARMVFFFSSVSHDLGLRPHYHEARVWGHCSGGGKGAGMIRMITRHTHDSTRLSTARPKNIGCPPGKENV